MVKKIWWWLMPLFVMFVAGCGSQVSTNVKTGGPTVKQAVTYQGPKARIAIAGFKCKAAKCNGEIGDGVSDMLSTSLFQSGRFIVLERGEGLEAIKEELNLSGSGYIEPSKAARKGLMEGADILVIGSITAFEPNASGMGVGGIVIPGNVPLIGGVKVGKKEAYIAADIRLIDVRTGRVINATTVEGKASNWKVGGLGGGLVGSVALGGGLSVYKNTPMEKAVRVMIDNAVQSISQLVPENYYRYQPNGQPVNSSAPQAAPAAQPVSGGIIGGGETFVPGDKVLFAEDFSKYQVGDIPTSLTLVKGQVEVAQFNGKKWLRALSGDVVVTKKIDLPQAFAVEADLFLPSKWWHPNMSLYLGNEHSPDNLFWRPFDKYAKWSDQVLQKMKVEGDKIHHFVIQQKEGRIKVFIDGVRMYQAPIAGGIVGGRMPNRNAVTIRLGGIDPSQHKEGLVTNIKVTAYTK
ncbi:CsgG/HfaB family protein [Galenea microaerophila]